MPERSSAYVYLLYGLTIESNAAIGGVPLADRGAVADLVVDFDPLPSPAVLREGAALVQHGPHDFDEPLYTLFRRGDDYLFDFPDGVQFVIRPDAAHIRASWPAPLDASVASVYLVSTVLAFVLRLRGYEVLHAASVVIDGAAVAIVGPGGAGKSTLAACLAERGFTMLSEDVTALIDRGECFEVLPSHARIRLWPDAATMLRGDAQALPFLADEDWKQYLELTDDRAALARQRFRLAAIYSLDDRFDTPDRPGVTDLAPREGLVDLIANTWHTVRDPQLAPANFERLGRIAQHVPLRLALPHKDLTTAFALADRIVDDFRTVVRA
jgi:predicted nucleic acid-binding protein